MTAFLPGLVDGTAAARDLLAAASSTAIPVTGTSFDSTNVLLLFLTGSADYNLNVLGTVYSGNASVASDVYNQLSGGTVSVVGNVVTITMPYYTTGYFEVDNVQLTPIFAGQLVATAVIPEPASIIAAMLGGLSLAALWRHRGRVRI